MSWLSAASLAGLPGLPSTQRGVLMRAQAAGWSCRTRSVRGGQAFEYLSTDLPPETQQALAAQAAGAVKPAADAIAAGKRAKEIAQVQACATSMAKYGITLEAQGGFDPERNPKLDLFQRFEKYHAMRGTAVWPAIQEFVQIWAAGHIEAHANTRQAYPTIPAKTLDKWYRAWRTQGVEALLERKPRKDKGKSALTLDDELNDVFIAALAEMHDPTARQVQRVIRDQLGKDRTPPTSTLKRWLRDFKDSNPQELEASLAMTNEVIERLHELLHDLPPVVQLDALFNVYIRLGIQHGQLEKVASSLLELGGSILYGQMAEPRPARTSVPASAEPDQHPAPSNLH